MRALTFIRRISGPFLFLLFSSLWTFAQSNEDCLMCHGDRDLTARIRGRQVSLFVDAAALQRSVHASLACVDCHQGLNPSETPHAKVIKPVDCGSCHDITGYLKSVHAQPVPGPDGKVPKGAPPAATCADCHGTHEILSPQSPQSATNRTHVAQACGKCHESVESHYARSAHGTALAKGVKGAPSCVDCHRAHDVELLTDKDSPLYKTQQAKVCLKCHLDNPEIRLKTAPSTGFIAGYENSVHAVELARGNVKAATCSDCHGAHSMKAGGDPTSSVSKYNIPKTCGRCHVEIAKTYDESIHGKALREGDRESPNCTDCHGEHQIYAPSDVRARVAPVNVSAEVCAVCHSSVALNQKYGLPSERFRTFADSYHGLASLAGQAQVANCASCHGVHNIKPSSDPTSTINKANLAKTCGQCHPGAGENFAKGLVHVVPGSQTEPLLYWVRAIYISLIGITIGGMFAHNVLDFLRKSRIQIAIRRGLLPEPHHSPVEYLRMSVNERIQHALLAGSFIVLVFTGFMLKFPDAWWVRLTRQISENTFQVRSLTHRIAGVLLIAVGIYHAFYLFLTSRGRRVLRDILPKLQDVRDMWDLVRFNLGIRKVKPRLPRFSYIEKAEYWALIWGTVVMAGTGFILWFDNYFINLLTKLGWDVARTIHYYEAILAGLAILVWHFYFVIFNPSVYPINTSFWNGKLTEEQMEDEHGLELEQIRSAAIKKELGEA
jgi:cytochrome b subunit of formate dehydrogenase